MCFESIKNQSYLAAKMYHTSAKLKFGGGEKYLEQLIK